MKKYIVIAFSITALLFTGCASKDEMYYKAVKQQNENYLKAYNSVQNESVTFKGTFEGDIKIVKPKKLPALTSIQRPKSTAEVALDWGRVIVPAATSIAGLHYGYKAIDSSNRANSRQIEAYTGNFQNTTDTSSISTEVSNTTSDTSTTSTTSTTTSTDTSTTNVTDIPSSVTADSNSTTIVK